MSGNLIRISEIFGPTIQGEGALIGTPSVFIRTGGCDYRCVWCDTLHAVDSSYRHEWNCMNANEIMDKVERLTGGVPLTLTISGGNPATQNLEELLILGKSKGYSFALETQGSIAKSWFEKLDMLVLSPKPPSSMMATDFIELDECVNIAGRSGVDTILKFAVLDAEDYAYARDIAARYPDLDVYLQPVNRSYDLGGGGGGGDLVCGVSNSKDEGKDDNEPLIWLIDIALQDRWYNARILPQLHVMLWGNERGV